MTISYPSNYLKILMRWRGSVWKAVWKELLIWLTLYYVIKLFLKFCITEAHEKDARKFVSVFHHYTDKVPLQFLLGFYVGQGRLMETLLNRWWLQIQEVPWPDDIMAWVCACVPGSDQDSILRRRLVARYFVLSETLVLRTVSTRIRKRFPELETIVKSGLMTKEELKLYKKCPSPYASWQLPIQWAINGVLTPLNSRKENPVNFAAMGHLMNAVNVFRENLRQLFTFDWVCVPLVYTQTVSVVVYGYFALCLVGHQSLAKGYQSIDLYVPVLTILQFVFYVGWFKVAQYLMKPFGDDDEDIELNYMLDRHWAVAMDMANFATTKSPPLVEDPIFQSYEKLGCEKIKATKHHDRPPKLHSQLNISVPSDQMELVYKSLPININELPADQKSSSIASIIKRGAKKMCAETINKEYMFF